MPTVACSTVAKSLQYSSGLQGGTLPLRVWLAPSGGDSPPLEQDSPERPCWGPRQNLSGREADGPGHRLVDPLILLLSQVADLPQEGFCQSTRSFRRQSQASTWGSPLFPGYGIPSPAPPRPMVWMEPHPRCCGDQELTLHPNPRATEMGSRTGPWP